MAERLKKGNIWRHHFAMSAGAFAKARALDTTGCTHREVNATSGNVLRRVQAIKWGWDKKIIYRPDVLEERLANSNPRLFDLIGKRQDGTTGTIGYSLVMQPVEDNEKTRDLKKVTDGKLVEIENLALFPGNEGGGRGWKFFTGVMDKIYNEDGYGADTVYWSVSSSNFPRLREYYERMGMGYLGKDQVKDFNKNPEPEPYTAPEDTDSLADTFTNHGTLQALANDDRLGEKTPAAARAKKVVRKATSAAQSLTGTPLDAHTRAV